VLLALLASQVASARSDASSRSGIPNARGVFSGCYRAGTGELRLVPGSRGC
jgi:hypothetical protein